MVEVSDSILAIIGVSIPILLGLFYFITNRKDRRGFETQSISRDEEEGERDKLELARKVKKELADEAEKIETIRRSMAVDVRTANQADIDQKIKETVSTVDHKLAMYEQIINSRFTATDLIMKNLLDKIVETAEVQATALLKINDSIDYLRKLLYEMSGKVNRVEKEQNNIQKTKD